MVRKNFLSCLGFVSIIFISAFTIGQTAFAATSSGSYDIDDVTPTLHSKQKVQNESSIFDDTRVHVNVGLLESFQSYDIAPGIREQGGIRGFQLGVGVDLFSPNWIAQGVIMNFPATGVDDTTLSSNAFELRIIYDHSILEGVTLHGGAGLGNRFYDIKSQVRSNLAAQESTFNSGAAVLIFGADYWPSGELSAGLELSTHVPLANGNDPSSIDLAVNISGHF